MSNNLGGGVSRVLNPAGTGFVEVIWQQGKPPCDAELNLLQEISDDWQRKTVLRATPSGWLANDTNASAAFVTNGIWSNWFKLGRQRTTGEKSPPLWAVVNGWLVPVTGTRTGSPPGSPNDTDTWNLIALDPPPANSGDFRIDYVFLEVWLARVPPNPSTLNKPRADSVYKYGNVEGGMNFLADDITDPALGFETTQRVQLQYRIRVVKGLVGLATYPDGFDPNVVKAQGAAAAPITGSDSVFVNMRDALGDPGLWRAGDGTVNALDTVDGYSYAIPIAAVFRRNSVAWSGHPSQNLNGAFNRNPVAVDRSGILTFSVSGSISDSTPVVPLITNVGGINSTQLTLTLAPYSNLPLPSTPASAVLIKVGDELMQYQSITVLGGIATMTLTQRGSNGTRAEVHPQGTPVEILSGRPDSLFSDQIAVTDILDLRHAVNPNGFNYPVVLQANLDKLLRGHLRANWKRTGAGPQGPFVPYQDMLGVSAGTGITKLDVPDGIRYIFSDAAVPQKVELLLEADGSAAPALVSDVWTPGNYLSVYQTYAGAPAASFSAGDTLSLTVADLKAGLPGGDSDQVRWINDGVSGVVAIYIEGQTDPVPDSLYVVTPVNPTSSDDLVITLGANFPTITAPQRLKVTATVQYGPGRGLSRRPDSIHSLTFTDVGLEFVTHHSGVPSTDFPLHTAWAPLWSKFRSSMLNGSLPVTAEAYADLGSKTVVLQPLRRLAWPQTTGMYTYDGTAANPRSTSHLDSFNGTGAAGSRTFTDVAVNFQTNCQVGDALVIVDGSQPGRYTITDPPAVNSVVLDRPLLPATGLTNLLYHVYRAQGLMPLFKRDGTTPKWLQTDPFGVFSGQGDTHAASKNMYVSVPRHMVPGWGEFRLPVYTAGDVAQNANFAEGINFMLLSNTGNTFTDGDKDYVPYYFASGSSTFATFSTWNNTPPGSAAVYNALTGIGGTMAGMRKFTDTRGLGRKGLELPPFYGIARLFAVYEATDYFTNGSAYDSFTREPKTTGVMATNLLRQKFDGPTFWVEIDDDGDSTFILNADMLDLARSPSLVGFDTGHFIIEASIFGFDRDAFDITKEFRLVLTRAGVSNTYLRSNTTTEGGDQVLANRYPNGVDWNIYRSITGGVFILPSPLAQASVTVNYSRTPYQGDAFGTQTSYQDIGYYAGPVGTGDAYVVSSTSLDPESLTRPNQKPLEVLASCGFSTTMGSGRITGDVSTASADIRNIGYEDMATYPPPTSISSRPTTWYGAFIGENPVQVGTEYLGCTERLPLGALFRDKDFRGNIMNMGTMTAAAFIHWGSLVGVGALASLSNTKWLEQSEVNLSTADMASGQPGEIVVHVDGNQSNYSLLTNYRVFRGGSAFSAFGNHPGGEVGGIFQDGFTMAGHSNILHGMAYLVRNAVTMYGASEVSAGDELMMLVLTTVQRITVSGASRTGFVTIGTNGSMEGYSAADLYRIEGRPLVNDNVRLDIDPSTIVLPSISYRTP
jgi:hypothetical protein